jgi:hypothetical protein
VSPRLRVLVDTVAQMRAGSPAGQVRAGEVISVSTEDATRLAALHPGVFEDDHIADEIVDDDYEATPGARRTLELCPAGHELGWSDGETLIVRGRIDPRVPRGRTRSHAYWQLSRPHGPRSSRGARDIPGILIGRQTGIVLVTWSTLDVALRRVPPQRSGLSGAARALAEWHSARLPTRVGCWANGCTAVIAIGARELAD